MKRFIPNLLRILPDRQFINIQYFKSHGHFPNLKNPRTFNEKLQWYKLYYRDPVLTRLTDKYEVRKYIQEKGYPLLLNDLYGVYDSAEEINFAQLPARFALKATHGSNMNIICKDKRSIDWKKSCTLMDKWLEINYFYMGREWAYKNIKPRLICERYLENEEIGELIDYKIYCFHGKPEVLFVCTGRYSSEGVKYHVYDMNWNRIFVTKGKPSSDFQVEKPNNFQSMIDVASELTQGFPFSRVDFYEVQGKMIFSELTFYPDCGLEPFKPDRFNYVLGDLFLLPDKAVH
jgi:hypothetical protein